MSPHGGCHGGRVGDVSVERPHAGAPPGRGYGFARQDERIDGPGPVTPDELGHEDRPDESGRPGDQDLHRPAFRLRKKRNVSVETPADA